MNLTQGENSGSQALRQVYLDNAATSFPKPPAVVNAIRESLSHSLTVARSTHHASFQADEVLRRCRLKLAGFINAAGPEEIIYTYSATDSLSMALHGLVREGGHVLVSPLEHHSIMRPLYHLKKQGRADFTVLPADPHGIVAPAAIRRHIRPETCLIAINWISNVSGTQQPAEAMGELASELGIPYLLDASQAAGTHPIDVAALRCTALAMPGHKSLMSIPGTGVLYLNGDCELPPWRIGGTGYRSELLLQPEERPYRYESGTPNVAGIVGLDSAMDWFAETGLPQINEHCSRLTDQLIDGLNRITGCQLTGPPAGVSRGHVVSFTAGETDPIVFSEVLASEFGITSRPGLHCAPGAHEHFGTYATGGTVRLSVGYFTTRNDIEYALEAIEQTAAGF